MNSDKANIVGQSTNICPEQHRYAKYVDQDTRLRGPGCSCINCLSSDNVNLTYQWEYDGIVCVFT